MSARSSTHAENLLYSVCFFPHEGTTHALPHRAPAHTCTSTPLSAGLPQPAHFAAISVVTEVT